MPKHCYFFHTLVAPNPSEMSPQELWCVDAAGAHWKQQPLLLCCSWCPEQPDLLMVQDNAPAGGARLLPVLWLLPEAGTVNGRSQACPWAVYAWACEQDTPFCLSCPQLSSVCSSAKRRKDDKDRKKNRKPSYLLTWGGKFHSGPAIEALIHGFCTTHIECMQMQIPSDSQQFKYHWTCF